MDGKVEKGWSPRKGNVLLILLALLVVPACAICLLFLLFNSPAAINSLGSLAQPLTGYRLRVDDISLSASLAGEIKNLCLTERGEGQPLVSIARIAFKADPRPSGAAVVEKLVLVGPRFRFVLKEDRKETDWAGLDKLPPVRLLRIEKGVIDIIGPSASTHVSDLDVTVTDFSPRSGGRARVAAAVIMDRDEGSQAPMGKGRARADIRLASLFPHFTGKGVLFLDAASADVAGMAFRKASLETSLSLDRKKLLFEATRLRIASFAYGSERRRNTMENLLLTGSGSFTGSNATLVLDHLGINLPGTGELSGNGSVVFAGPYPWKASFAGRSIDFTRVFALLNSYLPEDYRKWDIQGKGNLQADLEGDFSGDSGLGGTLKLTMGNGGFSSADKTKAAAGLNGEVVLKLHPTRGRKVDFTTRLELKGGEVLWGSYYRDFAGEAVSMSSRGYFSLGDDAFLECEGDADLFRTGEYRYSLSARREAFRVAAGVSSLALGRLYTLLAGDVPENSEPLPRLQISGTGVIDVSLSRLKDRTEVQGRIRTVAASLTLAAARFAVKALDLDVPFHVATGATPLGSEKDSDRGEAEERGFIRIKGLEQGGIRVGPIDVPLVAGKNRWETTRGLDVELFGGRVSVGRVKVTDPFGDAARVSLGVTARGLSLAAVTREVGGVEVQGMINGDLGEVSFEKGEWSATGGIGIDVFGGAVEVTNLSASAILAPSRTLAGDVFFRDLDLEQVTNLVEMGKVTGIVKGSLTGFTMAYGEPSSFVLVVETDTSKKARRMISVDAIKNLSIIGTGSSGISGVLNSGINRFFRAYPYSRIGIMCTLKNDTFRLRGTIREGGREYLIRKALFRGIDVINQNPDNAISFRDMQERIGRIFESGKAEVS